MRYVTISELLYINACVTQNAQLMRGTQDIRDRALLEAAAARPAASAFGADAYATIPEKAAVLLQSVALNHPFTDGNKRTATVAALFMLYVNGLRALWNDSAALQMILDIAARRAMPDQFVAWLQVEPIPTTLTPDADHDRALITGLLADHRWLLAELARQ